MSSVGAQTNGRDQCGLSIMARSTHPPSESDRSAFELTKSQDYHGLGKHIFDPHILGAEALLPSWSHPQLLEAGV